MGLLRVFKDYYPEIIVGDAVRGKASAFKVRRAPIPANVFVSDSKSTPTSNGASSSTSFESPMPGGWRQAPA